MILTRRLDIATIITHHLRKSEGDGGLAHAGSTALVALSDVAVEMRLDRAHAPNRRLLKAVSRFDVTPREFVLELQGQRIICLGSPDALTLSKVSQRVMAVLSGSGKRLTRDDVRDALDNPQPSPEQVARALKSLHGQGRVARYGRGVRGDPHLWEIETTTKPPFSRGNELQESET